MAAIHNDEARYLRRQVVLKFSYQIPATNTDAPTVIRDGQGAQVLSIGAPSSGVSTVTLKSTDVFPGLKVPQQITFADVKINKVAGVDPSEASVQLASWSASARTFTITYRTTATGTAGTLPLAGAWVSVVLQGPELIQFNDAA